MIKVLTELMSKCTHNFRKWKYDESIVQHWVETQWSGQIVKKDNEKNIHEEAAKEASEMAQADLSFEAGNDALGRSSGSADANAAWPTTHKTDKRPKSCKPDIGIHP